METSLIFKKFTV